MGVYWATYVYHGRLLDGDARDRLADAVADVDARFVSPVAENRWILHAPRRLVRVASIDPVLEDVEAQRGWVHPAKVEALLRGNPQWDDACTPDEAETLGRYARIAAPPGASTKTYVCVCEVEWSTLGGGKGVLRRNVRAELPKN